MERIEIGGIVGHLWCLGLVRELVSDGVWYRIQQAVLPGKFEETFLVQNGQEYYVVGITGRPQTIEIVGIAEEEANRLREVGERIEVVAGGIV